MTFEQAVATAFPNDCPCCWKITNGVYLGFTTLSNLTGVSVEVLVKRVEYNLLRNYCMTYLQAQKEAHRVPRLGMRNGYVIHSSDVHLGMLGGRMSLPMAFMMPVPGEGGVSEDIVAASAKDPSVARLGMAQRRIGVLVDCLSERRKQIAEAQLRLQSLQLDEQAMVREAKDWGNAIVAIGGEATLLETVQKIKTEKG